MKRCIVFTFLGPILGLFGVALLDVAAGRGFPHEFGEGGVMSLIFSLIVSVVTLPVAGSLAYVLPIPWRAPLTAIVGATALFISKGPARNVNMAPSPCCSMARSTGPR